MNNEWYPESFIQRMKNQLGMEYPAFLAALGRPAVRGIRLNPYKLPESGVPDGIKDPVPWAQNGYYLCTGSDAGSTILHEIGAFYIQEPGAMFPAEVLEVRPGEHVLDLCASPGGKSTQLGIEMEGKGLLVCNEPVPLRARILSRNIERIGLPNTVVTCARPEYLARRWAGLFDAVLVDAPCSGEGMFRREPASRKEWTAEKAAGCAERQRGILEAAAALVRPGGRLVYSTCTYNPQENEENVKWFLNTFPDFEPESFQLPGIDASAGWFTFYPHRLEGEGQFAARLRKRGDQRKDNAFSFRLPLPDSAQLSALNRLFPSFSGPTSLFGHILVSIRECPDLSAIKAERVGLHLGECKGTYLIPDHASALCINPPAVQTQDLSAKEAAGFTAGETIETNCNGWTLVRYRGIAAGWGKGTDGTLKNHYPKGLRKPHLIA